MIKNKVQIFAYTFCILFPMHFYGMMPKQQPAAPTTIMPAYAGVINMMQHPPTTEMNDEDKAQADALFLKDYEDAKEKKLQFIFVPAEAIDDFKNDLPMPEQNLQWKEPTKGIQTIKLPNNTVIYLIERLNKRTHISDFIPLVAIPSASTRAESYYARSILNIPDNISVRYLKAPKGLEEIKAMKKETAEAEQERLAIEERITREKQEKQVKIEKLKTEAQAAEQQRVTELARVETEKKEKELAKKEEAARLEAEKQTATATELTTQAQKAQQKADELTQQATQEQQPAAAQLTTLALTQKKRANDLTQQADQQQNAAQKAEQKLVVATEQHVQAVEQKNTIEEHKQAESLPTPEGLGENVIQLMRMPPKTDISDEQADRFIEDVETARQDKKLRFIFVPAMVNKELGDLLPQPIQYMHWDEKQDSDKTVLRAIKLPNDMLIYMITQPTATSINDFKPIIVIPAVMPPGVTKDSDYKRLFNIPNAEDHKVPVEYVKATEQGIQKITAIQNAALNALNKQTEAEKTKFEKVQQEQTVIQETKEKEKAIGPTPPALGKNIVDLMRMPRLKEISHEQADLFKKDYEDALEQRLQFIFVPALARNDFDKVLPQPEPYLQWQEIAPGVHAIKLLNGMVIYKIMHSPTESKSINDFTPILALPSTVTGPRSSYAQSLNIPIDTISLKYFAPTEENFKTIETMKLAAAQRAALPPTATEIAAQQAQATIDEAKTDAQKKAEQVPTPAGLGKHVIDLMRMPAKTGISNEQATLFTHDIEVARQEKKLRFIFAPAQISKQLTNILPQPTNYLTWLIVEDQDKETVLLQAIKLPNDMIIYVIKRPHATAINDYKPILMLPATHIEPRSRYKKLYNIPDDISVDYTAATEQGIKKIQDMADEALQELPPDIKVELLSAHNNEPTTTPDEQAATAAQAAEKQQRNVPSTATTAAGKLGKGSGKKGLIKRAQATVGQLPAPQPHAYNQAPVPMRTTAAAAAARPKKQSAQQHTSGRQQAGFTPRPLASPSTSLSSPYTSTPSSGGYSPSYAGGGNSYGPTVTTPAPAPITPPLPVPAEKQGLMHKAQKILTDAKVWIETLPLSTWVLQFMRKPATTEEIKPVKTSSAQSKVAKAALLSKKSKKVKEQPTAKEEKKEQVSGVLGTIKEFVESSFNYIRHLFGL